MKTDVEVDVKTEGYGEAKALEAPEIAGKDVLQNVFRDRVFNGIYQGTSWQFHRYGIDCKLSGSVYAVSEIDGAIPLIHGPNGCAFHQRLTPRKMYAPVYNLPCTELDENDVIYGGEEKLRKKIYAVYHRFHPSLIAVLPTCVSGLVGDDVQGVITEVEVPCDVLYIPSEGFAHRSRESLDLLMRDYAESWKDPTRSPAYDLRGCGHEEVMFSLVDQLMEEQDIVENLVNIESFGRFTYGFESELQEIKHIFGEMGVRVNLTLPTCTVAEIKRAPAAELNIVTRNIRWAERMKENFGNDYLRKWFFYFGFDGVEKFYLDVASKLGLDGEADAAVKKEKMQALGELERYQRMFGRDDFAVSTQGFFFTPYLVNMYAQDLKLPIKYLCVDTQLLKGLNISDRTIEIMMRNMEEAFSNWDMGFEVVMNPTLDEMSEIAKNVDHVLSDRITPPLYEKGGGIGMVDISTTRYLLFRTGFSGIVEFSKYLANVLHRSQPKGNRKPIISRFDYDTTYYPLLADPMCMASREMWSTMWGMKSEKE